MNFTRLTEDNLYTQLVRIVKMATEGKSQAAKIGILTSSTRNEWAAARMKLMEGKNSDLQLNIFEDIIEIYFI